ncbi:MAG: PIG-L family deacetylase [Vulcanimicrobiota bacterium]
MPTASGHIDLRLRNRGRVLYLAAHPDDENPALLAYWSFHKRYQTAYLSLTRGEGGQNLLGPLLGEPLGLIRTHESEAAGRIDGARRYFTRASDFGYSKHAQEALDSWRPLGVLEDIIAVLAEFRPQVVVSRFSPEPAPTHGHHTAAARLALEAFEAVANQPWAPRRLVWNRFGPPGLATDVHFYSPLLGKSGAELAAEAHSMHKSQGFGTAPSRGPHLEYFEHLAGVPAGRDLFEDIEVGEPPVLDLRHPHRSLEQLTDPELVVDCLGLRLRAQAAGPQVRRGPVEVTLSACNPSPVDVRWQGQWLPCGQTVERTLQATGPVAFELEVAGRALTVWRTLTYTRVDPVAGQVTTEVLALPEASLRPLDDLILFPDAQPRAVTVELRAHHGPLPPGRLVVGDQTLEVPGEGRYPVEVPAPSAPTTARLAFAEFDRDCITIELPPLPRMLYQPAAQVRLVPLELQTRSRRVGYLAGAGDAVPEALQRLGYSLETDRLDTLVVGVRAFNVAHYERARLAEFVRQGGTLVVQYHTLGADLAPLELELSRGRVTDQDSAVRLLAPDHPVFTTPNRIGPADFQGWVHERGLYFASSWHPDFQPLLSCHDPGEPALEGGLLVAPFGRGYLVYTGLSLFRQLPAGVPGAYRLLANLVALGA